MEMAPVDLSEVVRDAAASLSDAAAARNVTLTVTGEPTAIRGIKTLLYEIAYNLTDNAIKYNHEGGYVHVSVAEQGESAVLTIEDNGIGIPKEHQARIFERFYRVDKSHSKETGGTGLGLSIVKHAVLLHRGEISLDSNIGCGTVITVALPKQST